MSVRSWIANHLRSWTLANSTWSNLTQGGPRGASTVPGLGRPAENIVMVYAAIKARCDAVKKVPLRISDDEGNFIMSGPLAELLEQPNQFMDQVEYLEALEGYLSLYDEVFIALVRENGKITEMIPLSPVGISPIDAIHKPTGLRVHAGWVYRDPYTGASTNWTTEDMIAITGFNPHAPMRGLGPTLSARRAMMANIAATDHNLAIFTNGGSPDYVLETDQSWNEDQAKEFLQRYNDRNRGFSNAHKTELLYGGIKAVKMGFSNSELQFLEGLRMSDQQILSAFRVYPAMVCLMIGETGLSQGNSTTEQKAAWWNDIGLAELGRIGAAHQRALAREFAADRRDYRHGAMNALERRAAVRAQRLAPRDRLWIWFDDNQIPELVEHRRSRIDQFDTLLSRGYRPDDLNDYYDLGLPPHPTNIGTVPMGMMNVDDLRTLVETPAPSPAEAAMPGRAISLLNQIERAASVSAGKPEPEARAAKHAQIRKVLDRFIAVREKAAVKKWSRFFIEQRGRILNALEARGAAVGMERASVADVFDIEAENQNLVQRLAGMWREHLMDGWASLNIEVGLAPDANPFAIDDPRVIEALEKRSIQGRRVNSATEEKLREIFREGFEEGLTNAQIGDRVADYYAANCIGEGAVRPKTAARTQVAGIVNDGRMLAARNAGNMRKGWLHGGSAEPRAAHLAAQSAYLNNPIPLDEPFVVNGFPCDAPGSTELPVSEVANCTCMVVFSQAD